MAEDKTKKVAASILAFYSLVCEFQCSAFQNVIFFLLPSEEVKLKGLFQLHTKFIPIPPEDIRV